jgi:hypothetical protein
MQLLESTNERVTCRSRGTRQKKPPRPLTHCSPLAPLGENARLAELLMEFGPNLRMPHSRAMGDGLFELRPRGREGIGRALYCFVVGQRIVVLHAFIKKTQDTPEKELRLARKRMKEV